ncbi:MAG: dihydrolipoyl dehydrogenase [Candidatus Micrarchaeota archaeon]|nr:dihydrolipoyl dehydrogenase [Candidatus Micrarchaeota archaeon]
MVVGNIGTGTQVAILGGGPGGYVAAIRAAQLGKDVTVIEKDKLGGVCLQRGCIPSKAIIYAANEFYKISKLANMGVTVEGAKVDFTKLQAWKTANVAQLTAGIDGLFKKHGITLIKGNGFFVGPRRIQVVVDDQPQYIDFEHAIIATGSRPIFPPGLEADGEIVISSTEALELKTIPKTMVIVGGGYIGLELGVAYAKLGTHVTVVEKYTLAANIDRDLLTALFETMEKLGIKIYEFTDVQRVQKENGKAVVSINVKDKGMITLETEKVLVSIGRRPNTDAIGLDKAGVNVNEKGFVPVNEKRQTNDPRIYAIGDVSGHPMLAHKAYAEAKVAAECIAGKPSAFDTTVIPWVMFSDPEIAGVGLSESDAQNAGHKIKVGKFPFAALGRAVSTSQTTGFVKIVAEEGSERILGVHIVGSHASGMVSEAALGLEMGMTLDDLALTIHPHPTFPEALAEAAEVTLGKAIHLFQKKS